MEQEVTSKNTKREILEEYNKLLEKIKEQKAEEPKKIQEQQKKGEIVKISDNLSQDGIINDIAALKTNLSTSLDKLGENLLTEFKKLEDLKNAIGIEKKNLEDIYQLSAETDSLAAMLLAQKQKKEEFDIEMEEKRTEFEKEMAEKKVAWKKEQEIQAKKFEEEREAKEKAREREEEEYQYNLNLKRKKDGDIYEQKKENLEKQLSDKKIAFEKEFAQREEALKTAEIELNELRSKNENFPAEIKKAVDQEVKNTIEKLQSQFKYEKELNAKQMEGELKLKDQTIQTLREKIKDLEVQIKEYSQKAATAENSVKDIAIKAIEGSSVKQQYYEKHKESVHNKE